LKTKDTTLVAAGTLTLSAGTFAFRLASTTRSFRPLQHFSQPPSSSGVY
jgi:hypothetical protein